jgi:hypothetical protein
MKTTEKRSRKITAAAIVVSLLALMQAPGCRSASLQERVGEIDAAFRAGISQLIGTTAFVGALESFDFENAGFLNDVIDALGTGRSAARELMVSIDALRGFDYGGELAPLGRYVEEYSSAGDEAVNELQGIYSGLEDMMLSIEPVLREEAAITQMEAPQSDEEFLERLARLDAALTPSLAELNKLEVPVLLQEYKALFEDILTTLHKLVGDLIAVVSGKVPDEEMESNPDFMHLSDLLAGYLPLVDRLYGDLKVTAIDPLVEQVELEINRLYLSVE